MVVKLLVVDVIPNLVMNVWLLDVIVMVGMMDKTMMTGVQVTVNINVMTVLRTVLHKGILVVVTVVKVQHHVQKTVQVVVHHVVVTVLVKQHVVLVTVQNMQQVVVVTALVKVILVQTVV